MSVMIPPIEVHYFENKHKNYVCCSGIRLQECSNNSFSYGWICLLFVLSGIRSFSFGYNLCMGVWVSWSGSKKLGVQNTTS